MQKTASTKTTPNLQKITSSEPPQNPSLLRQKVKWAREQAGWTQAQAAVAMGVARGTFNAWEKGRAIIPPSKLHRLKHLAHVNFAEFKPALVYDKKGYPLPFSITDVDRIYEEYDFTDPRLKAALKELEIQLAALEGEEYPERAWVRALSAVPSAVAPSDIPKAKKRFMELNAARFQELLALGTLC